jgi:O-antigen/teichoic acid export membrane protein
MQQLFKKIIQSGFAHVFIANSFSYFVTFCASIAYARLLGTYNFGIYSFCYSIITFFLLVNGFGAASGILQFVSKSSEHTEQLSYLKYSIKLGILFNLGLSIIIFVYAVFFTLPVPHAKNILIAMAFFPVGRLYIDVFQAYLRATRQNQLLAKFSISTNSILLILNIGGIYYAGLIGLVVTTYISYAIIIIIATHIYKLPNIFKITAQKINTHKFISYSIYATIGNAFSQLLFILDILLLGYIVKDTIAIAIYKVATVIPFAINFIPGVVITFFYPLFAKNANDLNYVRHLKNKVQKVMLGFSIPISIILILIARPLITFIFGKQYTSSIVPFQILTFGFWIISSFRILYGNILASLGKAKFTMLINLFIVIVNIIATYTLVINFGIIGAAWGVVFIYCLSSGILWYVLRKELASDE